MATPDTIAETEVIDSMKDNGTPRFEQPSLLVNYRFKGDAAESRYPYKRVMDNSTSGNFVPVGGGSFTKGEDIYFLYALPNGKIWVLKEEDGTPIELTLSGGANPMHEGIKWVRMDQYFSKMYMVVHYDSVQSDKLYLVYDGITDEIRDISSMLPSGVTDPVDIFSYANAQRQGVCDVDGETVLSKVDVDPETDGTPYDTGNGAFSFFANKGNGLQISKVAQAAGQLVISKMQPKHRRAESHKFTGSKSDEFKREIVSPTVGFYGASGVEIGTDIFGITPKGFDFLRVIEELGETTINSDGNRRSGFTGEIEDNLLNTLKEINKDKLDIMNSVYDENNNEVYFGVPIGVNSTYNNLAFLVNLTQGKIRFSILNQTMPCIWFKANGFVYHMDDRAEIWKMNSEDEDSYEEPAYPKILMTSLVDLNGTKSAEEADQTPVTYRIQNWKVDIESEGDDKDFYAYYENEIKERNTGTIYRETTRKLKDYKSGKKTIKHRTNRLKTKGGSSEGLGIADVDYFDERIEKRCIKNVAVNQEGVLKSRLILVDDSTGKDNVHRIYGYSLEGRVSEEII